MKLDNYEREILQYVDSLPELPKVDPSTRNKIKQIAKNTLKKDKRVNIRMSKHDLIAIQRRAIKEGLPYQTLISSLIHKYVIGNLTEINQAG